MGLPFCIDGYWRISFRLHMHFRAVKQMTCATQPMVLRENAEQIFECPKAASIKDSFHKLT